VTSAGSACGPRRLVPPPGQGSGTCPRDPGNVSAIGRARDAERREEQADAAEPPQPVRGMKAESRSSSLAWSL